jgi:hypothetical protein
MNWRPCLQTGLTSLAAAIISLFVIVPASFAKELTPEEQLNLILLQHPLPRLSWVTWIRIEAQEKGSPPQLEAKLLITVEKGVTRSVAIKQSTGFKAADTDIARWIQAKWRFRPEITRNFILPVYVIDDRKWPSGKGTIAEPLNLTESDVGQSKTAKTRKLLLSIDIDHGRITNIRVIESSGDPKLDANTVRWMTTNWLLRRTEPVFSNYPSFLIKRNRRATSLAFIGLLFFRAAGSIALQRRQ